MRGYPLRAALVAAAVACAGVLAVAGQPPATPTADIAAPAISPEQIKQQLDKIKKGRTLAIPSAEGTNDSGGATLLGLDNTSPYDLVVLIVGPTTERVLLGRERMQTLTLDFSPP